MVVVGTFVNQITPHQMETSFEIHDFLFWAKELQSTDLGPKASDGLFVGCPPPLCQSELTWQRATE